MKPPVAAAALGVILALAGGSFDAEPLFVAGVAFLVLAVGTGGWVALAARGARIDRELGAHHVVEDEPLYVRILVSAGLPTPGGEIVEPLIGGPVPLRVGRRRVRVRVEARFARRGLRRLDPPALVLRDPLGLASREVRDARAEADEVLVLPRVEPVTVHAEPGSTSAGHTLATLVGVAEVEIDGLRAYRPGSPASRIHWPALARGAGLLERRLRPDADGRPLVVLDPRAPARPEDLDAAVRAAASLAHALAKAAGCALLLPGERRATGLERDLGAWPAAWARLAVVAPGPPPPLAGLAARTGPVFYVAASPLARLPRALSHASVPRVLVVPGVLAGRREVLAVAGCRGYAIGRAGRRTPRRAAA
jgi:uncharacterized protein (DUF58 family)